MKTRVECPLEFSPFIFETICIFGNYVYIPSLSKYKKQILQLRLFRVLSILLAVYNMYLKYITKFWLFDSIILKIFRHISFLCNINYRCEKSQTSSSYRSYINNIVPLGNFCIFQVRISIPPFSRHSKSMSNPEEHFITPEVLISKNIPPYITYSHWKWSSHKILKL